MENGKDVEILKTNLQSSFWRKVKIILRQNKKVVLEEFLFGPQDSIVGSGTQNHWNEKIKTLQNQVNSLQDRIRDLEITLENSKYAFRPTLKDPEATKISQQGNSTLEPNKGVYSLENNPNLPQVEEPRSEILKSVSDISKIDFKLLSMSPQYNLSSSQDKGFNVPNFITLRKISEEEKIEIIKMGFQLQAEEKISLKKYYESTDPYSLLTFGMCLILIKNPLQFN
jgi:hypothetical protein